jgi:F-type H+-transporting ATPase subunit delta
MFPSSVAQSYARALLQAAGGQIDPDRLATQLRGFAAAVAGHADLGAALRNPALPIARRQAVARAVLAATGAEPAVVRLVETVLGNGHAAGIGAIAAAVDRAAAAERGVVAAEVRVARPADPADLDRIRAALVRAVGREVELKVAVDPNLIGGFVARAGDLVFDGSIARQMDRLRAELVRG